ncbi:MAG TPA: c-type cytochrome [Gammaproteobacteria bacterium]
MAIKIIMAVILGALLTACGKKEDVPPPPVPQSEVTPAVETAATPVQKTGDIAGQVMEKPAPAVTESEAPMSKADTANDKPAGVLSRDDALALAKKSGCIACHSVGKKVVGPALQDVGARYKGDDSAKAKLVDRVKKGGKGNWTEVTGGASMPPYSPRIPDADIEKLVSFILSLG